MPAGSGGPGALDWEKLQQGASTPSEVVLVAARKGTRRPFALVQAAESDGVEVRIGTFAAGEESGYDVRAVKWRMPGGGADCRIDQDGRRWLCRLGGFGPPGRGRPGGDPGGVTDKPRGEPPGSDRPEGEPDPRGGSASNEPRPEGDPPGGPPGRSTDPPGPNPPPPGSGGTPVPAPPPIPDPPGGDPPGNSPPPAPPPPPPPPEGGGEGQPPEPEPPKGKGPRDTPDEEMNLKTPQELSESGDTSKLQLSSIQVFAPTLNIFDEIPKAITYMSFVPSGEWSIAGAFSVQTTLASGKSCCVTGNTSNALFSDARGIGFGLDVGRIECVLSGFHNVRGTSVSTISVCVDQGPQYDELAILDLTLKWHISMLLRGTLIRSHIGPIIAETGLSLGLNGSHFEVHQGASKSAHFEIHEEVIHVNGSVGTFASLECNLGGIHAKAAVDVSMLDSGSGGIPKNEVVVSLGLGCKF